MGKNPQLKNSMRKKESSVNLTLVNVQLVNVSGKINAGKLADKIQH